MRVVVRVLTVCLATILLSGVIATAQETGVTISTSKGATALAPGKLYVMNYWCAPLSQEARARQRSILNLFDSLPSLSPTDATSETFGFYLYKGAAPTAGASSTFASATNVLGLEHVYTRDLGRSSTTFTNTGCSGQYIIKGSDTPSVMAYLATSKDSDKEFWAGAATLVTSSMGPLASLLGGQVPAAVSGAVNNGSTLLNNYTTFLEMLDNTKSASQVVKLKAGHMRLATQLAAVEIDITPVQSLLLGKGVKFRDALNTILQQSGTIPDAVLKDDKLLVDKCNSIANAWLGAGLTSPVDLAYVTVQQLLASSPDKHQLVQCLGSERAAAALPYLHLFRIVREMRYSASDLVTIAPDRTINDRHGQQPNGWADLDQAAKLLIKQGTRFGAKVTLTATGSTALDGLFADEVQVTDDTTEYVLRARVDAAGDSSWSGTASEMLGLLGKAGIEKWGCFVETDKSTELTTPHHDALVVLAFLRNGDKYEPMVVHVLFDSNREIAELLFSDDLDSALIVTHSKCTMPTPQQAVTVANASLEG